MPDRSSNCVRRAARLDRLRVPYPVAVPAYPLFRSQIDDGEYPNPDNVERVPEQTEAEEPPRDHGSEAERRHLQQHDDKPDETEADVQTVRADEREEGRQKGAVRRAG